MVVDYTTIGGMVFALLHAAVNTSNATSFTATGLPAALTPARQQLIQLPFNSVEDNSVLVGAVATIMLAAASNVLTFNLNGNANGFTAANQKGLAIPVPIVWGLT